MNDKKPTYEDLEEQVSALRKTNETLQRITDESPAHIAYVSIDDLRYRVVNKKFEETFGLTKEEFAGKHIREVIGESNYQFALKHIDEVKKGKSVSYENYFKTAKGDMYVQVNYAPDFDERGEVRGIVVMSHDISERRRAEEAQKESEHRYKKISDMTSDYFFRLDVDDAGDIKMGFATEGMKNITGRAIEEVRTPDSWLKVAHPEDKGKMMGLLQSVVDLGQSGEIELRTFLKSGQERWVLITVSPELGAGKQKPVAVWGSVKDITVRRRAEEALRQTKLDLEKAQRVAHVGSWKWHIKTGQLEWSDEMYRIFGISRESFTGSLKDVIEKAIHPDDRAKVDASNRAVAEEGKPVPLEYRIVRDDGTERVVWGEAGELELDGDSNPNALTGIVIDITERKKAEESLRENEVLLREAQRIAKVGSWSYDAETQVPVWSEEMFHIFGLDPKNGPPDYQSHRNLIHPEDWDRFDKSVADAVEKGVGYDLELRLVLPNGDERAINTICQPHLDEKGRITKLVGAIRDITKQKEIEAKEKHFMEQEKMATIGKIAGKMAHDFNNVLGIIMGTAELLQTEELSPEMRADMEVIIGSAQKGRELTRNLLFFAKDQEPKFSRIDVNEKIDLVVRSLRSDLKSVEINLSYGSGMENLIADAGLLENALINMFQNSIHAMSKTEKPRLSVTTYAENNDVCIEIEDNGCGIPQEWKDKIFDPLVSLKGSADKTGAYKRDIKGSGYGMANVKRFVDKHGGTIRFESEEGKGTKFRISLPMIKEDFSAEEMETIRQRALVKGKRILVVEDEPHFGRILYSLLEKFDHRTDLVSDGKMALDHIKNNVYDAVSLDYILPDMNGMEVYRKLRETDKEIPIVFVSGNFEFMQSMIDLKKEDPKVDHLAKPFNNVEYVNKIHSWLAE